MSDSEYDAPPCSTDCRSNEGVTVGLVDGIIAIARVLRHRQMEGVAIEEALTDLRSDEDVAWLFNSSGSGIGNLEKTSKST